MMLVAAAILLSSCNGPVNQTATTPPAATPPAATTPQPEVPQKPESDWELSDPQN